VIGKLFGIVDSIETGRVILNVQGVGYLVFASGRTLGRIGRAGDTAALLIDTHVREDHIHLYGFIDAVEQQWFRLLTSVQGVGAKVALSILSAVPPERLGLSIAAQDKAALTQADGVGPKLAVRILTELKDKAGGIILNSSSPPVLRTSSDIPPAGGGDGGESVEHDALSALVNLGYARADAYQAILKVKEQANDNDLQSLIRLALRELSA
jgi:Holliday junction DNA helicase RuvA